MDKDFRKLMDIFEQISAIPRCSKKEEKISEWVENWSFEKGFRFKKDPAGNLLISVPASENVQGATTVILQGHMDMVCEKKPDSNHDFSKDPIVLVYEGDIVRANNTSLGADNGIGMALALAAASDESSAHPPMELLFTVDEETGLTGAGKLKPGWLSGNILINIDSENEGKITVGCAGGSDLLISLPLNREPVSESHRHCILEIGGLKGGHSGVNIHEQRVNAIKILTRILLPLLENQKAAIVSLEGGKAHNAIPREARAQISLPPENMQSAHETVSELGETAAKEFSMTDPGLKVTLKKKNPTSFSLEKISEQDALKAVRLIYAIPHGVYKMSYDIPGLVETSSNLAAVQMKDSALEIVTSQRSSVMSQLDEITETIKSAAKLAGASCQDKNGYPAWEPNMDSPLLAKSVEIYRYLYGKKPKIETIHAGLECGVIGSKYPSMDMISIGPNIEGAHSPNEKLDLGSVQKIRDFLAAILNAYASA